MKHEPYLMPSPLDPVDKWCRRFAIVAGIGLLVFWLTGCATVTTRTVEVETAPGATIKVAVLNACYDGSGGAFADVRSPGTPTVYLCGHASDERHELDHVRGMRHTAWVDKDFISCARVTVAGYRTRYRVGQRICMNKINRQEWTE